MTKATAWAIILMFFGPWIIGVLVILSLPFRTFQW